MDSASESPPPSAAAPAAPKPRSNLLAGLAPGPPAGPALPTTEILPATGFALVLPPAAQQGASAAAASSAKRGTRPTRKRGRNGAGAGSTTQGVPPALGAAPAPPAPPSTGGDLEALGIASHVDDDDFEAVRPLLAVLTAS